MFTSVDAAALRRTMASFATGVSVITTEQDGELHGMTLNSLTSVSLEPPLLLVCLVRDARTAVAAQARGAFVVNILRERQHGIATHFAKRGDNRVAGGELVTDGAGIPYIQNALALLHCDVDAVHDGGDHVIIVGRIRECTANDGTPLVFFRGSYQHVNEAQPVDWYW
jgi:flavin reductase (DIM6/NTAB) family NADH-FMN oxidoreductase RutF